MRTRVLPVAFRAQLITLVARSADSPTSMSRHVMALRWSHPEQFHELLLLLFITAYQPVYLVEDGERERVPSHF